MTATTQQFRQLLDADEILVIPAAFNPLSAKLIKQAGFSAAIVGGQVLTNTLKGLQDYGFITLPEISRVCREINAVTDLPLFVDADTGFGNAINVIQAVRELESAGVAGLFIEDQESPPRCGNIAGRRLVSTEEMVGKIHAAVDARRDDDFVICARTDARGVIGPDAAVERANLYAQAGADMTFVDGALSVDEVLRFAREVDSRYKLVNLGGAAKKRTTPRPPVEQLQEAGYSAVLFALNCVRAAAQGLWTYLTDLRQRGSDADIDFLASMLGSPFEDWYAWTGFDSIRDAEERYLPRDELVGRYKGFQEGYYVPGE